MRNIRNIRDVCRRELTPGKGLPFAIKWLWYYDQIILSLLYRIGLIKGTSKTSLEKKQDALAKIRAVFEDKKRCNFSPERIEECMQEFDSHLENPGLLKNVFFFCPWDSNFELMFYLLLWEGKTAEAMMYLHGYGWDLNGEFKEIPEDDVWTLMSLRELMNCDARKKARNIARMMKKLRAEKVVSLGCGRVPERYYDGFKIPREITLFDLNVNSEKYLRFVDEDKGMLFYQKDLFEAPNCRIKEQDFVWMTGVWPYLSREQRRRVIKIAAEMLKSGGHFVFDQILLNPSLLRVGWAQGWPHDPNSPMKPAISLNGAIRSVYEIVCAANKELKETGVQMVISRSGIIPIRPNPKSRLTSVQFVLKKIPTEA